MAAVVCPVTRLRVPGLPVHPRAGHGVVSNTSPSALALGTGAVPEPGRFIPPRLSLPSENRGPGDHANRCSRYALGFRSES